MIARAAAEVANMTTSRPLSAHALGKLQRIAEKPQPTQEVNPGVIDKLLRESLVELVLLPSPFKSHQGRAIEHLRATEAGRARAAGVDGFAQPPDQQQDGRPEQSPTQESQLPLDDAEAHVLTILQRRKAMNASGQRGEDVQNIRAAYLARDSAPRERRGG